MADARPLTYNGLVIGTGGSAPPRSIAALTNGQLAIGSTGNAPVPGSITGAGGLVVTGGAGTLALTTRGFVKTTQVGTVGGGEDTLRTWTVPGGTVVVDGGLHVSTLLGAAGNANTKTYKFHVGGSSITLNPTTTAPNGVFLVVDLHVWYQSATSAIASGTVIIGGVGVELVVAVALSTTIDWTADMVVKFTGTGTADNDLVQYDVAMLAFRTP